MHAAYCLKHRLLLLAPAGLFLPASELKSLRRTAAERLLHALRYETYSAWLHGLRQEPVLPSLLTRILQQQPLQPLAHDSSVSSSNPSAGVSTGSGSDSSSTVSVSSGSGVRKEAGKAGAHAVAGAEATVLRVLCRTREQVGTRAQGIYASSHAAEVLNVSLQVQAALSVG